MGDTWNALIKSILDIFTENSYSKLPSLLLKKVDGKLGGLSEKRVKKGCPAILLKKGLKRVAQQFCSSYHSIG